MIGAVLSIFSDMVRTLPRNQVEKMAASETLDLAPLRLGESIDKWFVTHITTNHPCSARSLQYDLMAGLFALCLQYHCRNGFNGSSSTS